MAGDLFSHSAESRLATVAPLAQRLRPGTIDEFVGQSGVVGEGSALRRAIACWTWPIGTLTVSVESP